MSDGLQQLINYMIPAVGTPRGYLFSKVLPAATPETINFLGVQGGYWAGQPFRPSGIYMDNTQGVADLKVVINEMSYQMICPAGETLNLPFPAPLDVTATITGEGQITIVFVDVPVQPYRSF